MFGFFKKTELEQQKYKENKKGIWIKEENNVYYTNHYDVLCEDTIRAYSTGLFIPAHEKGCFTIGKDATFNTNIANMQKLEFQLEKQKEITSKQTNKIIEFETKLKELEKKLNGRKKKQRFMY